MEKKTVISRIFKVIGFTAVIAAIVVGASFGFNMAGGNSIRSYEQRKIFNEKENTLDVLVLGNSRVYASVSPMEMYIEYGFTSFDSSQALQLPWESYKFLTETLKDQDLKVLAMEVDQFFYDTKDRVTRLKFKEAAMKMFPLYETHLLWKDAGSKKTRSATKGYVYTDVSVPFKGNVYRPPTDKKYKLHSQSESYLQKFYDICEENGIELMLFAVPSTSARWDSSKRNAFEEFSALHDIKFVDLNDYVEEMGLDWTHDTRDRGDHLNYNGAVKVSKWLGKYLSENYGLESRKGDPRYAHWEDDFERYSKLVKRVSDGEKN